jgi:hypothetical protein
MVRVTVPMLMPVVVMVRMVVRLPGAAAQR